MWNDCDEVSLPVKVNRCRWCGGKSERDSILLHVNVTQTDRFNMGGDLFRVNQL